MSQSLSQVFLHIIFSTKNREAYIDAQIRSRLHAYLATVGRDNGSHVYRVGGTEDHVHLLATLPRTLTQAELLEEMKKHSSRWMKDADGRYDGFTWQRGYGAFSLGYNQVHAVIRYIDNQEVHHRTRSFQDEYRDLLVKFGVQFDERYVWD